MSAPSTTWSQRLSEVGSPGIKARRIFGNLTSTGRDQSTMIGQTISAGMTPVISYKVPSVATLNSGGYDSWLAALRTYLVSLNTQVTATFWHEPHGDMTPAEFRAGSRRFLDRVQAPKVAVGPIINGWLLDNRVADFASYTDPGLLADWDFMGVDSYQEGTASAPNNNLLPARAVPKVATWLTQQGFPNMRIVLGEYNGFTSAAIAQAGEWVLSTRTLWIGNVWNVAHTTFSVLTGDRLTAFKATKTDSRTMK